MKIFLKYIICLLSYEAIGACDFKSNIKSVVSLSGTTTVVLKELGLLENKKLKGISIFNPILEKEFKGRVYPGGIFLSQNSLSELEGSEVFADEGRELKRILTSRPNISLNEIRTRNLTPAEANETALKLLLPHLKSCENEILKLKTKVSDLEGQLLKKIPSETPVIFYLGPLTPDRRPPMVIVQDGVVKWLIQNNKIKTYPSELAYVSWSAKLLGEFPKALHVGIKDSGREGVVQIKKSPIGVTIIYPGSLVPGLSQLQALDLWASAVF